MKVYCPWEECKYNKEKLCTKEEIDISKMDAWPPLCMEVKQKVKQKEPAYNLKGISFPECASNCAAVEYFGVGECESVCGWKFDKQGNPYPKDIHWYQRALRTGHIDYWNFNNFLVTKTAKLFVARTKEIAEELGLKRIKQLSDGFYYGIMIMEKANERD